MSERAVKKSITSSTPKPKVVPREFTLPPSISNDLPRKERKSKYPENTAVAMIPIFKFDILKKNWERRLITPGFFVSILVLCQISLGLHLLVNN